MVQVCSLPLKKRNLRLSICEKQPKHYQCLPQVKLLHYGSPNKTKQNITKQRLSDFSILSENSTHMKDKSPSLIVRRKSNKDSLCWKYNQIQNSYIEKYIHSSYPTIITSRQKPMSILEDKKQDHFSSSWLIRFQQLKEFKDKYGHCYVPQRFHPNKSLGKWVHKHRQMARENVQSIKVARYRALEKIGFWLDPPDRIGISWNRRYSELLKYRNQFGNCNVPQRFAPNRSLGIWVHRQRGELKKMIVGQQTKMTIKRAQALFEIGFHQDLRLTHV